MRSIFQLCLLLLMLLGAGNRVWGKVAAAENIAVRGFAESGVFCSGADAPPALMSSGEMAAWGYEPALDVRDGPNLYAYVSENPWSKFDPDGLEAQEARPPNLLEFFNPNYGRDAEIEKGMIAVAKANPKRLVVGIHGSAKSVFDSNTRKTRYEVWLAKQIKDHPFNSKSEGTLLNSCNTGNTKGNENPIAARVAKLTGKETEAPAQYGYADPSGIHGSVPAKKGSRETAPGHVEPDYTQGGNMNVFDKKGKLVRSIPSPALCPKPAGKEDAKPSEPKPSFWNKVKNLFTKDKK
jgi:hypothetical protein